MKFATLFAYLITVGALHAQELTLTPPTIADVRALVGDAYAGGESLDMLRTLADELGPRLAGSEDYDKAVRWAVERFHAMGIADVRLEPVTLRHRWDRGVAEGYLLGTRRRALHVVAYGWSPPTGRSGVRGHVVSLEDTTDAAIAAAHVEGAIVLVDRQAFTGPVAFHLSGAESFDRQRRYETFAARLKGAGAAALLVYTKTVNQVLRTSDPLVGGEALALPVASIGREDALLVKRQMERANADIELHLDTTLGGPVTLQNVIAQIPGATRPDEVVMMGAHLDSWDLGTGAQDNGSGVAQVMDCARAVAALGKAPRRTMRFALWAAEEEGLNGSTAYVRAHGSEMSHVVAYLNTDGGAGRPLGWNVSGREDLRRPLGALNPLLGRLGGNAITTDLVFDTDTAAFFLAGVPALNMEVVDDAYDTIVHHKPADTLDKVDAHDLAAGTAMLLATAYALAASDARPVPRLTLAGVEEILRREGASDYVAAGSLSGLWKE